MSKRRNRSNSDSVSQETLERARKQAAETASNDEAAEEEAEAPAPQLVVAAPPARARVAPSARNAPTPRRSSTGQSTRKRKSDEKMSSELVAKILANPTKVVTEDELRQHYSFVVRDLRNMGILAAGLMVTLIVLAQVLPR